MPSLPEVPDEPAGPYNENGSTTHHWPANWYIIIVTEPLSVLIYIYGIKDLHEVHQGQ